MDRSVLEYHLETVTNRNQESDFEQFARAIAEWEICPNLLPHTGPSGGGDSKADSETYPVSDRIAAGWYYGQQASAERWAFAFSAKKDWRAKIRSDVKGIVGTARGYKRIFFITNQFVPDKNRAAVEDKLRQQYAVDVRILDRSWLVDSVLQHGREDIAIATLGVPVRSRLAVRKGPRDSRREGQLELVDGRITEALAEGRVWIEIVDDALRSAKIARSLERPRTEVDGRFLRARDLAERFGTRHQKVRANYEWAWASFWWFEDDARLSELYEGVEVLVRGSETAYHLELLSNLWMCLRTAVSLKRISASSASLKRRTKSLVRDLDRLSRDDARLGNALHARTLALQVHLLGHPTKASAIFAEMKSIVERADSLVNFPFQMIAQLVSEFGSQLGQVEGYNELFSIVVDLSGRRQGELTAARLLVRRGEQLLEHDKLYDAIATFGSALSRLYKDESREDVVRALYMCGHAYSRVGLLWAARGVLANAASIATAATWTRGEVTNLQAACYSRLRWIELQLGRLPQALLWHEVAVLAKAAITRPERRTGDEQELGQDFLFDGALGVVFLHLDFPTLRLLESLPAALDRLGLWASAIALRFALGYDDDVPDEWRNSEASDDPIDSFFRKWRDQPAALELPESISVGLEPAVVLESHILGCHVRVECENIAPCVEVGESIVAALESFLSTGLAIRAVAQEPVLSISVRRSPYAEFPFSYRMVDDRGRPQLLITCTEFEPHSVSHDAQSAIQQRTTDLLIAVFARAFLVPDLESAMDTLLRDERAIERAVAFTRSFVAVGNVLGSRPKTALTGWIESGDQPYSMNRIEAWDEADRRARALQQREEVTLRRARVKSAKGGEPPRNLVEGYHSAKHSEIRTLSLIRQTLWDEAKWQGVASVTTGGNAAPPVFGLVFQNGGPATEIFQAWREELGMADRDDRLHVSIVRGVRKDAPATYRVVIGTSPAIALGDAGIKYAMMPYRIQTMEPTSSENLDRFLSSYSAVGRYILAPAVVMDGESQPRVGVPLGIEKSALHVMSAWQVGRHDIEAAAILPDDDPIIPPGQTTIPVVEVLLLARTQGPGESTT